MKRLFLVLLLVGMPALTFAYPLTNKAKAIAAWTLYTNTARDMTVSAEVKNLEDNGFAATVEQDALLLGSGCGFAGCNYVYLVTTTFRTEGANTMQNVVAGVVDVSTYGSPQIRKVLRAEDLSKLME